MISSSARVKTLPHGLDGLQRISAFGCCRNAASACHDDLAVRIDGSASEMLVFIGKGFAEILRAPCDRILVEILARDLCKPVENGLRRCEIRKSLRKIHRAELIGNACHAADDGISEPCGSG